MMKKIAVAVLASGFTAFAASAAPTASSAPAEKASTAQGGALPAEVKVWLSHLKDALTQNTLLSDYQKGDVAEVAGVRGAKQDDSAANPDKPVWKGGFEDQAKTELKKERAALAQGVSSLLAGEIERGRTQILAFEKQYPNSELLSGAGKAMDKIAAVLAASQASGPAAAQPSR